MGGRKERIERRGGWEGGGEVWEEGVCKYEGRVGEVENRERKGSK